MRNELRGIETLELFGGLGAKFALLARSKKGGSYKGWNEPKPYEQAIDHVLQGGNLALLNGEISGGLVTIDIDSGYSQLGNLFPPTVTVLRDNAPDRAKLLYRVVGDKLPKYQAYIEPGRNAPSIEILSTGQTSTIPPTTLKRGEVSYVFARDYNQLDDIQQLEYGEFEELWNRLAGQPLLPIQEYQNDGRKEGGIWVASSPRMIAYARKGFRRELELLASAQVGQRNVTLNRVAFNVGQLVAEGLIDQHEVERKLEEVALEIGLNRHEVKPTIRSGLRGGVRNPRILNPKKFIAGSSDLQKQLQELQGRLLLQSWNNATREKDCLLGVLQIAERADTTRGLDISGYRLAKEAALHWTTAYSYLTKFLRLNILERVDPNEEYGNYRYNLLIDSLLIYLSTITTTLTGTMSIDTTDSCLATNISNSLGTSYMSHSKQLFLSSPLWVKGANYVDEDGVMHSLGPTVRDIVIQLVEENGLTVSEIASRLGKRDKVYAISKKLPAMETSGLVTKVRDKDDKRTYRLWLPHDLERIIRRIEERTTTTGKIERRNNRIKDKQQQNRERQLTRRTA